MSVVEGKPHYGNTSPQCAAVIGTRSKPLRKDAELLTALHGLESSAQEAVVYVKYGTEVWRTLFMGGPRLLPLLPMPRRWHVAGFGHAFGVYVITLLTED